MEVAAGEVATGDVATGEVATGNVATGEVAKAHLITTQAKAIDQADVRKNNVCAKP